MAWTAPLDWSAITNNIVTAAHLNEQIRDNLGILSTHAHTGAAGQGVSTMPGLTLSGATLSALTTLTFVSQGNNPDTAGELQKNGNDLLWYGNSLVNLTAADQAAGTASLRTLGTTSVKAAAGDHTHVLVSRAVPTIVFDYSSGITTGDEVDLAEMSVTPGAVGRAWICYGYVAWTPLGDNGVGGSGQAGTYTVRLKFDGVTIGTTTGLTQPDPLILDTIVTGFQSHPTVASHDVKVTVERTDTGLAYNVRSVVGLHEVSG